MQSFISGYAYAQGQTCSGRLLGSISYIGSSLLSAQAVCDTNEECACIYDYACEGKCWRMYAGQSIPSKSDCAWTRQGSLI